MLFFNPNTGVAALAPAVPSSQDRKIAANAESMEKKAREEIQEEATNAAKAEEIGDKAAVIDFWEYLSDNFLTNLKNSVEKNGIRGCWEYWSNTLNEEAAGFTMELDEQAGEFSVTMHRCPSKGRLLELQRVEPYRDYCEHCDILYRRVLEPLGFEYAIDLSECDRAKCKVIVRHRD